MAYAFLPVRNYQPPDLRLPSHLQKHGPGGTDNGQKPYLPSLNFSLLYGLRIASVTRDVTGVGARAFCDISPFSNSHCRWTSYNAISKYKLKYSIGCFVLKDCTHWPPATFSFASSSSKILPYRALLHIAGQGPRPIERCPIERPELPTIEASVPRGY